MTDLSPINLQMLKPEECVVYLRKVTKHFPGSASPTLNAVDFEVLPKKIHTILGFSGGGKSVTLKIILGLIKPDQGIVNVFGRNLVGISPNELNEVRKKFGMLFQSSALFDSLSVFDNIAFPIRETRSDLSESEIETRVFQLLQQVELEKSAHKMPSELSGGMKKRVGLARAIALEPELLLFDEPTTGLDPITSEVIDELIVKTTRKLGASALIISHNIHAALRISDFVSMIVDGKIIERGSPSEFLKSQDPRVQKFLRSAGVL